MSIAVVVPQFGLNPLTAISVKSLLAWHSAAMQVLIVDDGSEQGHVESLQALSIPNTEILRLTTNQGVTAAWNLAVRRIDAEFIVFLNNDTITAGAWCDALIEPLKNGQARITGVQRRPADEVSDSLAESLCLRFLLPGWCFAMRQTDILELGGFDPSLKLYFSDTDLQLRIAQTFGSEAICEVTGLPIVHQAHQTTRHLPTRNEQWQRDRDRFVLKWQLAEPGNIE